jgi:hypothetical protein
MRVPHFHAITFIVGLCQEKESNVWGRRIMATAIAQLHEFFPLRAVHLGNTLVEWNERDKALEKWREQQIFKFIGLLTQNAQDLELGFNEKRITKLAWAARNLLELSIWIDYCNFSDANATEFRNDSTRDLLGFSKAVQQLQIQEEGMPDPGLEASQAGLVAFAENTLGVIGLDEDYTRVLKAARELGREKQFGALNKLFSKYAHPTSFALHSVVTGISRDVSVGWHRAVNGCTHNHSERDGKAFLRIGQDARAGKKGSRLGRRWRGGDAKKLIVEGIAI